MTKAKARDVPTRDSCTAANEMRGCTDLAGRLHWQLGWLLTLEDAPLYSPPYTRLSGNAGVSRRHA